MEITDKLDGPEPMEIEEDSLVVGALFGVILCRASQRTRRKSPRIQTRRRNP